MRKTATRHSLDPYWHFAAGRTVITRNDDARIYRPRGMESWILHCTVEGTGELFSGNERLECVPGDMVLFPAGVVHDYGRAPSCGVWVHLWTDFFPKPSWDPFLSWPSSWGGTRMMQVSDRVVWKRIVTRMEDIIEHSRVRVRFRPEFCMNALEEVLLWCCDSLSAPGQGGRDIRIDASARVIRDRLDEIHTVSSLARSAALSSSRFAHLFRLQMGIGPMKYLERVRIARAQELLRTTNNPVKHIASECGYEDPLYFSHVFRRATGRSPRRFRVGR